MSNSDRKALARYRALAYTTAVLLIILVFVAVPLQYWAHRPLMAEVVGTLHGYLYIVYILFAFDLTRRLRVRIRWMLPVLLAGTVPFCAIVAERVLTRRFERLAAARDGEDGRRAMAGAQEA